MADKIYYGVMLTCLTGLVIWAIKAYVGKALENMAENVESVQESLKEVKTDLRHNEQNLTTMVTVQTTQLKTQLKNHFQSTCIERHSVCQNHIADVLKELKEMNQRQWEVISKHGHKGLDANGAKVTY